MKATNLRPLTFPLLTWAKPGEEAHGVLLLPSIRRAEPNRMGLVRRISSTDAFRLTGRGEQLREDLDSLGNAIALNHRIELEDAIEHTTSWTDPMYQQAVLNRKGSTREGLLRGARMQQASLFSLSLRKARFVFWMRLAGGPIQPGIFCPDQRTAAFAQRVLLREAKAQLCANPKCRVPFLPTKPGQLYHNDGCNNVVQQQKWRDKKRAEKIAASAATPTKTAKNRGRESSIKTR